APAAASPPHYFDATGTALRSALDRCRVHAAGDDRHTTDAPGIGALRHRHAPCFSPPRGNRRVGGTMNDRQMSGGPEAAGAVPRERRMQAGGEHGFLERVRRLVAENLGVDADELSLD